MITTFFTAVPVVLGLIMIAAAIWEFVSWKSRFSNWKQGSAQSLGPAKRKGDVGPHLAFEYTIDGAVYKGASSYMKDDLPEVGTGITIYYDPQDPANAEWYDGEMHRFFMFGVAVLGAGLIWLAFS